MLFQILRTLESLAAEVAFVRLQRHVDTNVRGDVVALDRGGATVAPLARQVQVIGALASYVPFTYVFLTRAG